MFALMAFLAAAGLTAFQAHACRLPDSFADGESRREDMREQRRLARSTAQHADTVALIRVTDVDAHGHNDAARATHALRFDVVRMLKGTQPSSDRLSFTQAFTISCGGYAPSFFDPDVEIGRLHVLYLQAGVIARVASDRRSPGHLSLRAELREIQRSNTADEASR
jgi:hypothetical protein